MQLQGNSNECDIANCAINSPQTQRDGTANSPTNIQNSKFIEEEDASTPPSTGPGAHSSQIGITTNVSCPPCLVCPQADDFLYDITFDGNQCTTGSCIINGNPEFFSNSRIVTFIILNFGSFVLTVTLPPSPPGLTLRQP